MARQCGFVVGPSFAGIIVQFSCGSRPWCIVPYWSVGLRNESMHAYRFAAITPYTHRPDFCPQWGGMQDSFFEAWRFPAGFHSVSTLFHSWDGSDKAWPLLIRHDPLIVQFSVQGTQHIEHGKLMENLCIGKANPHTQ